MPIPRVTSRDSLQRSLLPLHSNGEKPQHSLLVAHFVASLHPRQSRLQASFLAFISLILLSIYVLLVHCLGASTSLVLRSPDVKTPSQLSLALETIRKSSVSAMPQGDESVEQIQLTKAQELAAVSSFLASLPQNQVPSFVDPSTPIDPQLVLDFDVRSPRAHQEVQAMVEDVWSRNPVFLYSRRYSSASRDVKSLLNSLRLKPAPTIIDVDVRDDADVLIPMLHRLTSNSEFPILLVAGRSIGTIQEIHRMEHDGTLRRMIAESGATINGAKHKKHKH
ncbi:hypothetical protein AN958_03017 [Leucoagaricus sp. SymC.cos]|nr:hypothetical protein AN958_03017 [Leucoagaricus sp. SymC.cos]